MRGARSCPLCQGAGYGVSTPQWLYEARFGVDDQLSPTFRVALYHDYSRLIATLAPPVSFLKPADLGRVFQSFECAHPQRVAEVKKAYRAALGSSFSEKEGYAFELQHLNIVLVHLGSVGT